MNPTPQIQPKPKQDQKVRDQLIAHFSKSSPQYNESKKNDKNGDASLEESLAVTVLGDKEGYLPFVGFEVLSI